jgi:hypothetical protein
MLPVDDHLIGIDADGRVHVSERLLMLHEGPLALGEPEGCRGSVERVAESDSSSSSVLLDGRSGRKASILPTTELLSVVRSYASSLLQRNMRRCCCHSIGNAFRNWASPAVGRPSRIRSTMSGARSVRRNTRQT